MMLGSQCSPCCAGCSVFPGESSIWGTGGIPVSPYQRQPLSSLRFWAFGTNNQCSAQFPSESVCSFVTVRQWIEGGGVLCVKDEFPGCGNPTQMNNFLSGIGSSMSVDTTAGSWSCPGPRGYLAQVSSGPLTDYLPETVSSSGATGKIIGGTAILTAPPCPEENLGPSGQESAVCLAYEQIGNGILLLVADSNLQPGATQQIANNAVLLVNPLP